MRKTSTCHHKAQLVFIHADTGEMRRIRNGMECIARPRTNSERIMLIGVRDKTRREVGTNARTSRKGEWFAHRAAGKAGM